MKNELKMEWLCLKQHFYFSLRNRRYLLIAISQYLYCFFHWKQARNLRYSFCTLQLIDDLLDGDRPCVIEPYEYLQKLQKSIQSDIFDQSELQQMTRFTLMRIKNHSPFASEGQKDFNILIDVMMNDRKRVLEQKIFSAAELKLHHHTTFRYSLDIVLIALESKLRTNDLPEILDIFAWCSTVRDLEEDLDKQLVNIPLEVTNQIGNFRQLSTKEKINHPLIHQWLVNETKKAERLFEICDQKLVPLKPIYGSNIFRLFVKSMKKYTLVFNA